MTQLVAIDLGSNSFRLEIGTLINGQLTLGEYLKETVRQGNGLDSDRVLSDQAMQRGWSCLARFAERLKGFKAQQVRAVATQTLREARNRDVFLNHAQTILGFPIDVISGKEEARLIYVGVSHTLPQSTERRLVIDIGGRSTELILGQGYHAGVMDSFRVGSVSLSMRYFADGSMSEQQFKQAEVAAKAIFDEAAEIYHTDAWDLAYGSSGTIGAIHDILIHAGRMDRSEKIKLKDVDWLIKQLIAAKHIDKLNLAGLKDERKAVIPGGICILKALFSLLKLNSINATVGALRHGVLFNMVERESSESDVRNETISALINRFKIDELHGQRVCKTALCLLSEFYKSLQNNTLNSESQTLAQKILWAANLHEIGCIVSHSDHHKHGSYIVSNSDALGFSQQELINTSMLILGQKGKLRKLNLDFTDVLFLNQLICLRLAVILCHARHEPLMENLIFVALTTAHGATCGAKLIVPYAWAVAYPQSLHLLKLEAGAWEKTTYTFELLVT